MVDRTLPLNNTLGRFDPSSSVEARVRSFQTGIEQLLWPERRAKDILGEKVPGVIDRTTARSYVTIPTGFQPDLLVTLLKPFRDELRLVNERGDIEIGPIPKGVPVNLVANIDLRPDRMGLLDRVQHDAKLVKLLVTASATCGRCPRTPATRRPVRHSPTWSSPCSSSASARLRGQPRALLRHRPVRRGAGAQRPGS